uniref:Uncharacterized protein n=1 Tax=Oryza glumipatula TaxID=40148 RepID=A0A0E0BGU5_9ORYZ
MGRALGAAAERGLLLFAAGCRELGAGSNRRDDGEAGSASSTTWEAGGRQLRRRRRRLSEATRGRRRRRLSEATARERRRRGADPVPPPSPPAAAAAKGWMVVAVLGRTEAYPAALGSSSAWEGWRGADPPTAIHALPPSSPLTV